LVSAKAVRGSWSRDAPRDAIVSVRARGRNAAAGGENAGEAAAGSEYHQDDPQVRLAGVRLVQMCGL
jgi:hypothetical protein